MRTSCPWQFPLLSGGGNKVELTVDEYPCSGWKGALSTKGNGDDKGHMQYH
jgi:hypothetical protein